MVDLHIHTINSDGEYSTKEIIKKLNELKIELFSITDHDNINSCYEVENINLPYNMKYVRGIEFSSKLDNIYCHILGYNFNEFNLIERECSLIKKRKIKKILDLINHLDNLGIYISEDEKNSIINKHGSFGRMDLCKILIQRGYGSKKEIYDKYLEIPLITHRSNAEDIIDLLHNSGGISILAHPKEIELEYKICIEEFISYFIDKGLDGIEVYNSIHTLNDVKRYIEIARKYNLITTGGSDFHGSTHSERILGTSTEKHLKIKQNQINFHI